MLLFILVLGLVGTGTELILLKHYDNGWQIMPLALIGVGLCALGWHVLTRGAASVRAIQIVMTLCILSGGLGVLLHYNGNAEFELEMSPAIAGFELFKRSLTGATPALAPGTMVLLGLIGLVYTYRHPRLDAAQPIESRRDEWDA